MPSTFDVALEVNLLDANQVVINRKSQLIKLLKSDYS